MDGINHQNWVVYYCYTNSTPNKWTALISVPGLEGVTRGCDFFCLRVDKKLLGGKSPVMTTDLPLYYSHWGFKCHGGTHLIIYIYIYILQLIQTLLIITPSGHSTSLVIIKSLYHPVDFRILHDKPSSSWGCRCLESPKMRGTPLVHLSAVRPMTRHVSWRCLEFELSLLDVYNDIYIYTMMYYDKVINDILWYLLPW